MLIKYMNCVGGQESQMWRLKVSKLHLAQEMQMCDATTEAMDDEWERVQAPFR